MKRITHRITKSRKRKLTSELTVAWAASADAARPSLCHVHTDNKGDLIAVDGFRIHRVKRPGAHATHCEYCQSEDLAFPDTSIFYGKNAPTFYKISADADELRANLYRAGIFFNKEDCRNSDIKAVALVYSDGFLTVLRSDNVLGTTRNTCAATLDTKKDEETTVKIFGVNRVVFAMDYRYLIDALDHVAPHGGQVSITLNRPNAPMMINGSDDTLDALIMPCYLDKSGESERAIAAQTVEHVDSNAHLWDEQTETNPAAHDDYPRVYVGAHNPIIDYCYKGSPNPDTSSKPAEGAFEVTAAAIRFKIADGDEDARRPLILGIFDIKGSAPQDEQPQPQESESTQSAPAADQQPQPYKLAPVLEQARGLSSGTLATLTNRKKYDEIDTIHADFIEHVEKYCQGFDRWPGAWDNYRDSGRLSNCLARIDEKQPQPQEPESAPIDVTSEYESIKKDESLVEIEKDKESKMSEKIVSHKVYTIGPKGKLVESVEKFTDLQPGAVLRWEGPFSNTVVILKRVIGDFGTKYQCFNTSEPKNNAYHRWVDARDIKSRDDESLWHSQHYFIEPETVGAEQVAAYLAEHECQVDEREQKEAAAKAEGDRLEQIGRGIWEQHFKGCKAVIVAEHERNESDSMTDYFGSVTDDLVILAPSKHTRNLFSEMRKAAEIIPETRHLGVGKGRFTPFVICCADFVGGGSHYYKGQASPWHRELDKDDSFNSFEFTTRAEAEAYIEKMGAPHSITFDGVSVDFEWKINEEDIENRENYSMGHGYYLGYHRYSGWQVSKSPIGDRGPDRGTLIALAKRHDHLDKPKADKPQAPSDGAPLQPAGYRVEFEGTWTWVYFDEKPARAILDSLKAAGARWGKKRGAWFFRRILDSNEIAALLGEEAPQDEQPQPQEPESTPPSQYTPGADSLPENVLDQYTDKKTGEKVRWVRVSDNSMKKISEPAPADDPAPDFWARVDKAAAAIRADQTSGREFDSYFENYDGAQIVTMLLRKAETESALENWILEHAIDWIDPKYYHDDLSDSEVADLARETRLKEWAEWQQAHAEHAEHEQTDEEAPSQSAPSPDEEPQDVTVLADKFGFDQADILDVQDFISQPADEAPSETARAIVATLKKAEQDFEWYPTTSQMIAAVKSGIPAESDSIMDIGAGDGRVLTSFRERCEYAKLYAIEKAMPLIQLQPDYIIPVGTEFYEQNLSALPVEYIFCNPPYSDFEGWASKIIVEGYAKSAFLVMPRRWQESKIIKKALDDRSATTEVIYTGDFEQAERKARAKIEIVRVNFPTKGRYSRLWADNVKDPFDVWFDNNIDTFDKAQEFKESVSGDELARKHRNSNIREMVESYLADYQRLEQNYRKIFTLDYAILKELGINKNAVREGLKKKMSGLKVKYWALLFDRLDAITSRLTTKSRKNLLDKLTANNSVDFTENNAYAVVIWAVKNANRYLDDQLVDLFHELATFDGVYNYKSNTKTWQKTGWRYNGEEHTHYALDYRIVVSKRKAIKDEQWNSWEYPGNLHKSCHALIADIRAVLSNLGFSTHSTGSYNREWQRATWEDFYRSGSEDTLFQIKAFNNGNVHLRFMPDAIKSLNVQVGRVLKWINTEQEVVDELGYTPAEAEKYFNINQKLLVSSVKLLADSASV